MDVKIQPQTRNNILFLSNLALLALSGSRIFPYTINKMYKPAPIEKRLNNTPKRSFTSNILRLQKLIFRKLSNKWNSTFRQQIHFRLHHTRYSFIDFLQLSFIIGIFCDIII